MITHNTLEITECPRDAMQGWSDFIPTSIKVDYLNRLLKVGFHTLDFGSFVSPKAIPQLRDTADVLAGLDLSTTRTRLLAIVANLRGAQEAAAHAPIHVLGFPFSVSAEFQRRNTNASQEEALALVKELVGLCHASGKEAMIYLSMGFGNPYGEPWSPELVSEWAHRLQEVGVRHMALADTVGVSTPESIRSLFSHVMGAISGVEFTAHLHARPQDAASKVQAAYEAGCRRFDSALRGIGGCPMADDALVGNVATETLVSHFGGARNLGLDEEAMLQALQICTQVFRSHP